MKRLAAWLRAFADWLHPDSRPPCVIRLDAERAYIDGVTYIEWRIAQERMWTLEKSLVIAEGQPVTFTDHKPRKPADGTVSAMNESLTRAFHGSAKPRKRTTKRTKGATKP